MRENQHSLGKKMKKLTILALCLTLLSLIMFTVPVAAQATTVGVGPGDWFKYGVTESGNSTVMHPLQWEKVQVISVSGTNVTAQGTWHYQAGDEQTFEGQVDVETGEGNLTSLFIAANLSAGYAVSIFEISGTISTTIDSTTNRTYSSGARETNHVQYSSNNTFGSELDSYLFNDYWDKSTGALVEMDESLIMKQGADTTIYTQKSILVDSGAWAVPEFPLLMLPMLFAALTLAVVAYKRRQPKISTR
jgi:hypothetical protein